MDLTAVLDQMQRLEERWREVAAKAMRAADRRIDPHDIAHELRNKAAWHLACANDLATLRRTIEQSASPRSGAEGDRPRACGCQTPDPVMQADGRFYCYTCSFQTGARPSALEPECWLRAAKGRGDA